MSADPVEPSAAREHVPWYRHPWVALVLAVLSAVLLVSGLVLRYLVDPVPEDLVRDMRTSALFSGLIGALLAGMALDEKSQPVHVGRSLLLRIFPGADRTPPPVTPESRRWAPVARTLGFAAMVLTGCWYVTELASRFAGFVGGLL